MNNSEVKPYVYVCTHRETGAVYIGARWANKVPASEDLGKFYFTSSKNVKPIFDEFDYEILFEGNSKEAVFDFESELIKDYIKTGLLLNKHYSGKFNNAGKKMSDEAKAKISAGHTGKKFSEEHKAKLSAARKGKSLSETAKAKLSATNTGRKHSDKTKAKLSAANKGKKRPPMSEEHKAKLSAAIKGKKLPPLSDERKAAISAANKGRKMSDEAKAKLSAAIKAKKSQSLKAVL